MGIGGCMGIAGPAATPELHIHVAVHGALPAARHVPGARAQPAHTHMSAHTPARMHMCVHGRARARAHADSRTTRTPADTQ